MPKEAFAYKDFFSVGGRPGVVRSLDQPGKAAPGRPAKKQRCGDEGGPSRGADADVEQGLGKKAIEFLQVRVFSLRTHVLVVLPFDH